MISVSVTQGRIVKEIEAEKDMTIMEILRTAGIFLDLPCGGRGHCGKCAVKAYGKLSLPAAVEEDHLSPELIAQGFRLACLARAQGDIQVFVPEVRMVEIETGGSLTSCEFSPAVTCFSYGDRFEVDFRGVVIDSKKEHTPVLGAAFDIGTTTLAARFFDLETGKTIGTEAMLNPQRKYGADVISRIAACENDTEKLHNDICGAIVQMTSKFCTCFGAAAESIYHCTVAGNTVMQHIAAGISPTGMARSPFEPVSLFGCEVDDDALEIGINSGAHVYFSPCVSAFVGGDITAGMLACGFDKLDKPSLFVDIGTNGEMALLYNDEIFCCSTAAGPAFEGAHIACGTGSVAGAISRVTVCGGKINYETIGGEKPIGICGSGLIDAAAALLDLGLLDETGALCEDNGDFSFDGSDVYINQRDLREVQLAKSAIAAGIDALLDTAGLKAADISQVFVAGGFGTHMDIKSACRIGLLPKEFLNSAISVGNAALSGASMLLLNDNNFKRIEDITQKCRIVELAGNAFFEKQFIENMLF